MTSTTRVLVVPIVLRSGPAIRRRLAPPPGPQRRAAGRRRRPPSPRRHRRSWPTSRANGSRSSPKTGATGCSRAQGRHGLCAAQPGRPEGGGRVGPARDEAAGEQCSAYGAAGIMRMPARFRITWQDDTTLKIETDAGTQTRLLKFGTAQGRSRQLAGRLVASWKYPRAGSRPAASARPADGPPRRRHEGVTTQMRPGYLRRNGVPYGANAVMTEYFDRLDVPGGDTLLVIAAEIADPEYLAAPYWTSTQFKRQNRCEWLEPDAVRSALREPHR